MARLLGAEPIKVNCYQNNGFKPRPEDIEAAITPKTKWLVLNLPNNPTGAACDAEELRAIASVLERHPHVWVMSDEMYEHLSYGEAPIASIAKVAPALADRVLTISGVSKTYAMTGWRIGFGAGPRELIRAMVNMQGQATAGVSSVGQAAAAAALDGPQALVAERAALYRRRRDIVVDALNAIPGLSCHRPEGAFYVFPNIAGCLGRTTAGGRVIGSDQDFAEALLEEQYVGVVGGAAFGMSPYLRLSYATDEASLVEGCRRISEFVSRLS
jgi:aspartate aminotransferase